ncbi:MAG: hypothetical protein KGQ49_00560 [Verrucomicrobia bacterium]|nr:hypothetical protein [Verrucomicrobiota bacterium]MBU6445872.1 hypothetical protein [Verrucomicrobiota bacterium]MDE3046932.1 hypothetical protein [Verrucomicrobiota bacterium]
MQKLLWFSIMSVMACSLQAELPPYAQQIAQKHQRAVSSEVRSQIHTALAAFNTLIATDVTYVSCPITSGWRLYHYMDTYGYRTLDEAMSHKELYVQNVIAPNLEESGRVSQALAETLSGVVIAPIAFEKGFHALKMEEEAVLPWGQHEFMSLWLRTIEHKVTRMVLVDGWQYSSGASEEFLWASLMQMGFLSRNQIAIVDVRGEPVTLDRGAALLYEAISDVKQRGLRTVALQDILTALIEAERLYRESLAVSPSLPHYDQTVMHRIAEGLAD